MKIIWHWLVLSIALYITAYFLPGKISFNPIYSILIIAACLIFINFIIKPIISILTLPINVLTLGLFSVVLNGAIFWSLTYFVKGFYIETFYVAIIAALVVSVINWVLGKIF